MHGREPIRVVLVDDHELFRSGLRALLAEEGVEVVAEAGDGAAAIEVIADAAPDVVVMDVNLPMKSGIDATREVRRRSPTSRVLVLSVSEQTEDISDAIVAGACGYLLKDSAVEDIAEGVRAAAAGESKLSERIAARLLDRLREDEGPLDELPREERFQPTDRELDLLGLIAAGRDTQTIAADLQIDPHAVGNHVSNVLAKLELRERMRAVLDADRGAA